MVVEAEEERDVSSVERKATCPGSVRRGVEEEATTSAGTAGRRGTWRLSVRSRRPAGGAGRRGTWWPTALSLRSASTVVKKVTALLTVRSLRNVGGARRRATR